jgi:hypothetical protein
MTDDAVIYTRRRVRDVILNLIRSDSVRNLIWVYYFWFIIGSIHLTFFTYPIKLIVGPMGQWVYNAWAWMPLVAAPLALAGLVLRHGGSPADEIHERLLRRDFLGLWMQIGGHTAMSIVLAVFIGTALYGAEPGQPTPSAYWLCAYLMGCLFLAIQCGYKVLRGMGKVK